MKTKKWFVGFILLAAFTLLFNQIFFLRQSLAFIFPEGSFSYPVPKDLNYQYVVFLKWLLSFVIPVLVSLIFIIKSKILDRLNKNWGLTLLIIVIIIYLARYGLLYASTFIEGGGATFVLVILLSYLNFPLKIMLVLALLKIFFSLSEEENIYAHFNQDKLSFFILTLGLGLVLHFIFSPMINIYLLQNFDYKFHLVAFLIFCFVMGFLMVYQTKVYKKITLNYGVYLLAIGILFYFINMLFRNFFRDILASNLPLIEYYIYAGVFIILLRFLIVAGLLKIFLSLHSSSESDY